MARRFLAILAQDNTETAEGWLVRVFPAGCFTWRTLPLTMRGVVEDFGGHAGAFPLGRIDEIRMEGNYVVAVGILDDEGTGEDADRRRDMVRQIEAGIINGISVDAGGVDVSEEDICISTDSEGFCEDMQIRLTFNSYEIGAATCVAIPALSGTLIKLDPPETMGDNGPVVAPMMEEAAIAAAVANLDFIPAAWLAEPADLPDIDAPGGRSPVVTDDGRVFGYLASWADCHVAFTDRCQTPWHSASGYQFAHHCGPFAVDEGPARMLAPLAVQGGHYPTQGVNPQTGERYAREWRAAQAHYDDPTSCAAYVAVGENAHGIWYAGALRQGVTPEQVALLRRHQLSGDWRRLDRGMELVGMCSVNFPGFVRQLAVTAAADGSFDVEAAVIGGSRMASRAAACCEACAASGGTCADHPAQTVEARLARVESMLGTLTRHATPIREDLRARLATAPVAR